jgi:hypothetical protein
MECVSFNSRMIASAAYYPNLQKLVVWLTSGRSSTYEDVPHNVFNNLVAAESPGYYYSQFIAHRHRQVVAQRSNWALKVASVVVIAMAISSFPVVPSPGHQDQTAYAAIR